MAARPLVNSAVHGNSLPGRDSLYVSHSEKTFGHEEHLPSLPVPSLAHTLERYLESVKALVTEEEYATTAKIVKYFQHGVGETLHRKLMERAHHQRNWLEKWWEDVAYLQNRSSLIPLCSMAGICNMGKVWYPTPNTQIEHAALLIYYELHFWKLLRKEKLKPHYSHKVPWSMHQFKRLFSTVRIPGEQIDKLECYFHTESEDPITPTHIIVLNMGHIFTFDILDEYGAIFTPPEIALQLRRIKEWCHENGQGSCVAALTTDDRSTWAKNRQWLLRIHPENALHMETINSSLFALCLDDGNPETLTERIKMTVSGDCNNRWADKSFNSIVYSNGTFGKLSDHTPFDGLVPVTIGHYGFCSIIESGGAWKGPQVVDRDLLPPRRLDFHIDDHLQSAIRLCQKNFKAMDADADITCNVFSQYGKAFMKRYNVHPEAYIQLALQLSYYRMYGKPGPTYVTAATRQFYHGRTETLRPCCEDVMKWVYAMAEESSETVSSKTSLLHLAVEKFNQLMKECMQNHGCDRHLLGLFMISMEEQLPVPELFMDPSWVKSGGNGNFILSTSCCGYTPLSGCVLPMREDGYGIFYNIEDNRITFTISAFNRCPETNTSEFYSFIEKALLEMEQLLLPSKL